MAWPVCDTGTGEVRLGWVTTEALGNAVAPTRHVPQSFATTVKKLHDNTIEKWRTLARRSES